MDEADIGRGAVYAGFGMAAEDGGSEESNGRESQQQASHVLRLLSGSRMDVRLFRVGSFVTG
jgi:hypothetical protein